MRYLIIILLIFFTSCHHSKEIVKYGQIEIVPVYCKYDNPLSGEYLKPRLFKKGKVDKEISLKDESPKYHSLQTKVSHLGYGSYYIDYVTIFNQINRVEFEVNQSTLQTVSLCVDALNYEDNKNVLLIDGLKPDETLHLVCAKQGCFDLYEKSILLRKDAKQQTFVAEFNGVKYPLSTAQVKMLRAFEIELRCNHNGFCSTHYTYTIFNDQTYEAYSVTDSSCQWRGFDRLIEMLEFKE